MANVTVPVHDEYPQRIAKMWKDQLEAEKKANKQGDVEMAGSDESDDNDLGRDLFKNSNKNHFYGSEDDSDSSENSGYDSEEDVKREQNAFNHQNAFGQ
jgi:hypothetical protein